MEAVVQGISSHASHHRPKTRNFKTHSFDKLAESTAHNFPDEAFGLGLQTRHRVCAFFSPGPADTANSPSFARYSKVFA